MLGRRRGKVGVTSGNQGLAAGRWRGKGGKEGNGEVGCVY